MSKKDITKCTGCGVTKTLENAYRDSSKTDGLRTRCKACKTKPKNMELVPIAPKPRCGLVELAPSIEHRSGVFERDGQLWVKSLDVARNLEKEHKEVLEKIRDLDCTGAFNERNFRLVNYRDAKGEMRPAYNMTPDGFIFLTSRFTGDKAARVIEDYIALFNMMESEIRQTRADNSQNIIAARDFEKRVLQSYERQDRALEVIAGRFTGMQGDVDQIKTRVQGIEEDVKDIKKRLPEPRIPFSTKWHSIFLHFSSFFKGRCPCCAASQITDHNGLIVGAFEKEHFFGRSRSRIDETWLICIECHKKKNKGDLSEAFLRARFDNYQQSLVEYYRKRPKDYAMIFGVILSNVG